MAKGLVERIGIDGHVDVDNFSQKVGEKKVMPHKHPQGP